MKSYLNNKEKANKKRKKFKLIFWLALIVIIL
jgi:predicted nucleic acid-binding Zn ribbon protein